MELQLLRNNASAFKKSAERSLEQRPSPNGQIEFFIVPAVVNLAFSIELYLKFLLAKNETPDSTDHNLSKLFDLLDSTIQQEIIDLTDYDKDEFKSLLRKHAKAFVEWRYMHERNVSINAYLEFMRKLADCVESIVNQS